MLSNQICVVHLVRKQNGPQALERFIATYRQHDAGINHQLLLVFKGFDDSEDLSAYKDILSGLKFKELHIADKGYDIGAYQCAFQAFRNEYQYFCFLNSFSEILHPEWLDHLYRNVSRPDVGLVGATGSYQSIYSGAEYASYSYAREISRLKAFVAKPVLAWRRLVRYPSFAPFPNPHVRTNCFMLSTLILGSVQTWPMRRKMDAYYFESGRKGLTSQVLKMGKKALIVGADGMGYDIPDWYKCNSFWRGKQENLLISDNQTRAYADADLRRRILYSYCAWREQGWPNLADL